jgi:transcription elongation GreA/GreB family factor
MIMAPNSALAEELDTLRARRRVLQASLTNENGPGDRGDQAEVLETIDELSRLENRISELTRRLARPEAHDGLPAGTLVRLRYEDGTEETLRVGAASEAENDDEVPVLSTDSPLGKALAGKQAGDKVTFPIPNGTLSADILDLQLPT